jgi:hypothetical protein
MIESGDEKALRDQFAAAALPAMAGAYRPGETSMRDLADQLARAAYALADAMLRERAKDKTK